MSFGVGIPLGLTEDRWKDSMFLEKLVTRKLEQMNVTHGIHTAFE